MLACLQLSCEQSQARARVDPMAHQQLRRGHAALLLLSAAAHAVAERRWAVVTGASSGIGEALARRAASRGYNVLLAARRREKLESLAGHLVATSSIAVEIVPCDLATPSGIQALCRATEHLDLGLVCLNAGICSPSEAFATQSEAQVDAMLQLNVQSNARLLAHYARVMERGHLLIVGSSAGAAPGVPGVAMYAATKAWVRSIAAGTGAELRRQGSAVSVTCAMPSAVDTEFAARSSLQSSAIFSLGVMGRVGGIVMSADGVAACALSAAHRRQSEVVPGLLPRLYVGLTDRRLLPRPLARAIAAFSFGESPFANHGKRGAARLRPAAARSQPYEEIEHLWSE